MIGALTHFIAEAPSEKFQPMPPNFGLLPELPERFRGKRLRYCAYRGLGTGGSVAVLSCPGSCLLRAANDRVAHEKQIPHHLRRSLTQGCLKV